MRGPGFVLPRDVAEALARVRDAEYSSSSVDNGGNGSVGASFYEDFLNDDDCVLFPPHLLPVSSLYEYEHGFGDLPGHLERQRRIRDE